MSPVRFSLALGVLLLVASPCREQDEPPKSDPQAEFLAMQAAELRDKHCSGVAGSNATLAARAFTPVS